MEKRAFSSMADWINISSLAKHIWQNADKEIIKRVLQDDPGTVLKKLAIDEAQIKLPPDSENIAQALLLRMSEESQSQKALQGQLLSLAYISLEEERLKTKKREYAPWETLLTLLLLAQELEFENSWLNSEKEGIKFLTSANSEIQEQCERAIKFLSTVKFMQTFAKHEQQAFYKKLNRYLTNLNANVENLEQYEKLQQTLLKITQERRSFINLARSFRKALTEFLSENTDFKLEGYINDGDIPVFLKLLNQNLEKWTDSLKAAASSAMPRLLDVVSIRRHLEKLIPPVPDRDFKLMLEELGEIEQDSLSQEDSQLIGNILPTLSGLRAFDKQAFEKAMEKSEAKDYSYKFIYHLNEGDYQIPDEVLNEDLELEAAGDSAECPKNSSLAEDGTIKEPETLANELIVVVESEASNAIPVEMINKDTASFNVEKEEDEQLIPVKISGERSASSAIASLDDGFGFMEDNLSAPPQPDEVLENSKAESMTLEQAWAISQKESAEMGSLPSIKDEKAASKAQGSRSKRISAQSDASAKNARTYFDTHASKISFTLADFWNDDGKLIKELVKFIANDMDGKLEQNKLEEGAAVILEMFPNKTIKNTADMLACIKTLQALYILRDSGKYLVLDPITANAFLQGALK